MNKYYLIGIKGAGMSALAHILHDLGHVVSGSDVKDMLFTQIELEAKGMELDVFGEARIEADMQVIIGNAFADDHPDVLAAKQIGAKVSRYHDFLGDFAEGFTSIAISGTHGKTTTTGLMSHVFRLNAPTSYLIGDGTGKGVRGSNYFVYEACEYRRHFLAYIPDYLIITNIEHDHPDYFKDEQDVIDAFNEVAAQTKKKVIMWGDDPNVLKLNVKNGITYGFEAHNNVMACNVIKDSDGTSFDVRIDGTYYQTFTVPFFGDHMILNSLAVITASYLEGLDKQAVAGDLPLFTEVKRRFNIYEIDEQILIDDYAHHPTEIDVTLKAVRQKYPARPVVAVFQPHTFTRMKAFLNEFKEALDLADHVYVTEIFGSARESGIEVNMEDILDGKKFKSIGLQNIKVLKNYEEGVLVFMGAGDIEKYQQAYMTL